MINEVAPLERLHESTNIRDPRIEQSADLDFINSLLPSRLPGVKLVELPTGRRFIGGDSDYWLRAKIHGHMWHKCKSKSVLLFAIRQQHLYMIANDSALCYAVINNRQGRADDGKIIYASSSENRFLSFIQQNPREYSLDRVDYYVARVFAELPSWYLLSATDLQRLERGEIIYP